MSRLAACFLLLVPSMAAAAASDSVSLGGPQVPGVCLLSVQSVVANAKVGVAASARLRELVAQAQGEIDGRRQAIDAEAKAVNASESTLKPAEFQQRKQALALRYQTLQLDAGQRTREIEATRQKVFMRISAAAQPVIAQVYKQRGCGLLVDRNAVLGGNFAGDLTASVVQGLDARATPVNFDRERLPVQTAQSGAVQ
jgi:Skp family chaperone for outer membrane proteins